MASFPFCVYAMFLHLSLERIYLVWFWPSVAGRSPANFPFYTGSYAFFCLVMLEIIGTTRVISDSNELS